MLDMLKRYGLLANLKKCYFHKNKFCFLDYIMSVQKIKIDNKKIEMVKNLPKQMSIKDI